MEDPATARLKNLVVSSNEALEFKLVRSVDDLENDETIFKPEMSHQVFGDRFVIKICTTKNLYKHYRFIIEYIYQFVHSLFFLNY